MRDYIEYLQEKTLKPFIMDSTGRIGIDYADMAGKPASYFIGSWLTALQPVTIYSNASTNNPIKKLQSGDIVGRIVSYVESNGKIWWMLEGERGFVEHGPGRFDSAVALETSSGKEHDEKIIELEKEPLSEGIKTLGGVASDSIKGIGSFLSGNILILVIGVVIAVAIFGYSKYKTA